MPSAAEIVAVAVTRKDIDDAAMAGALLDQIADPVASFTADGSYDQDQVSQAVGERHPDAAVIVPPRAGGVASASAGTTPTQRDRHLQMITERGRMAWQKASGYNLRARVEASIGRYKRVIGDVLRSRTGQTEASEVAIAAACLEPNAGARTPELCLYRLNNRLDWGPCARTLAGPTSVQHGHWGYTWTKAFVQSKGLLERAKRRGAHRRKLDGLFR